MMMEATVHALKTRLDEFVEREYVQARDVQAALLLLTDKLQKPAAGQAVGHTAWHRHQIDELLGCQIRDPELSRPDSVGHCAS